MKIKTLAVSFSVAASLAQTPYFESIEHDPFHSEFQAYDRTNGFELVQDDRQNEADRNQWVVFHVYAHRSTARIIFEKRNGHRSRWIAEQFAHAWAVQPGVLREALHHLDLRILSESAMDQSPSFSALDVSTAGDVFYGNAQQRVKTIFFPISFWQLTWRPPESIVQNSVVPEFEEVMTREMCRALDYELRYVDGQNLSDLYLWQDARRKDNAYITKYAKGADAAGDFAETCAAYILTRYSRRLPNIPGRSDVRGYLENVVPRKVAFFDLLFKDAHVTGELDPTPIWENRN